MTDPNIIQKTRTIKLDGYALTLDPDGNPGIVCLTDPLERVMTFSEAAMHMMSNARTVHAQLHADDKRRLDERQLNLLAYQTARVDTRLRDLNLDGPFEESLTQDSRGCYTYVDENGDEQFIQSDWDRPATAALFGWTPHQAHYDDLDDFEAGFSCPDECSGTDGTITCKGTPEHPGCGKTAGDYIKSATKFLDGLARFV